MNALDTYQITHNSVLTQYADRDRINMSPEYQRQGEIWSLEKRQLLVDSIINRYDIPKLYFHKLPRNASKKAGADFAVVDGRQRLESIFAFINGAFPLSGDFVYLDDQKVSAGGMTYNDLGKKYPRLKQRFDSFSLPIVVVDTDDLELIEEMFSRLNEAVPLNAAEKRNAIGGDMARTIRDVAVHAFFVKKARFSAKRYKHREVAARLLFLEHSLAGNQLIDTKKPYLDQFTRDFKTGLRKDVDVLRKKVELVLKDLTAIFAGKDILLAAQSAVPIYYLLFREARAQKKVDKLSRSRLLKFNQGRAANRARAEKNLVEADFELLEYDRMSQQGTNDAGSVRERLRILRKYCGI